MEIKKARLLGGLVYILFIHSFKRENIMRYLTELEDTRTKNGFTPLESTYIGGHAVLVGDEEYDDCADYEIKHEGQPNVYDLRVWTKSETPEKQSLVVNLAVYIPIQIGDFETELYFQSGVGYDYDGLHEWNATNRDNITNTFHLVSNDALSRLYYSNDSDIIIKTKTADKYIADLDTIGLICKDYRDVIALRDMLYYITPSIMTLGLDVDINNFIFEVEENGKDNDTDEPLETIYKRWEDVLTTDVIWNICEPTPYNLHVLSM